MCYMIFTACKPDSFVSVINQFWVSKAPSAEFSSGAESWLFCKRLLRCLTFCSWMLNIFIPTRVPTIMAMKYTCHYPPNYLLPSSFFYSPVLMFFSFSTVLLLLSDFFCSSSSSLFVKKGCAVSLWLSSSDSSSESVLVRTLPATWLAEKRLIEPEELFMVKTRWREISMMKILLIIILYVEAS